MKKIYTLAGIQEGLRNAKTDWNVYENEEETIMVHKKTDLIMGRFQKTASASTNLYTEAPDVISHLIETVNELKNEINGLMPYVEDDKVVEDVMERLTIDYPNPDLELN